MKVGSFFVRVELLFSKRNEGLNELPLHELIVNIGGPKIPHSATKDLEPPIDVFGGLIILHCETIALVVDFIKLGALDACIPNKELGELIPCSLGGVELANVSKILWSQSLLNHPQSRGIELLVHHFTSCQLLWVIWREPILHNPY